MKAQSLMFPYSLTEFFSQLVK